MLILHCDINEMSCFLEIASVDFLLLMFWFVTCCSGFHSLPLSKKYSEGRKLKKKDVYLFLWRSGISCCKQTLVDDDI